MNDPKKLRDYLQAERASYADLLSAHPGASRYASRIEPWLKRTRRSWINLNENGVDIPDQFLAPYPFPKDAFFPADFEEIIATRNPIFEIAQTKYQLRGHNVLRELDRCVALYPEAIQPEEPLDILELSAGGCGGAEVAQHYGHTYTATDFLGGRGSVYAPIHAALGLDVIDFDGSRTPYSFADSSFDIVTCFQAIDAYGYEEKYPQFIDEMLRIARRKVVIVFNPGIRARETGLENGFRDLIKTPIMERYKGAVLLQCPSTGSPAIVIDARP